MTTPNNKQAGERTQHTPGPWRIDCMSAERGLEIKGANGNTVIVEEDYFHFPDEMGAGQRDSIGTELAANARLIAAAPEFYKAAKDFVDYYSGGRAAQLGNGRARKSLDAFRAAIAKAEGRAS